MCYKSSKEVMRSYAQENTQLKAQYDAVVIQNRQLQTDVRARIEKLEKISALCQAVVNNAKFCNDVKTYVSAFNSIIEIAEG